MYSSLCASLFIWKWQAVITIPSQSGICMSVCIFANVRVLFVYIRTSSFLFLPQKLLTKMGGGSLGTHTNHASWVLIAYNWVFFFFWKPTLKFYFYDGVTTSMMGREGGVAFLRGKSAFFGNFDSWVLILLHVFCWVAVSCSNFFWRANASFVEYVLSEYYFFAECCIMLQWLAVCCSVLSERKCSLLSTCLSSVLFLFEECCSDFQRVAFFGRGGIAPFVPYVFECVAVFWERKYALVSKCIVQWRFLSTRHVAVSCSELQWVLVGCSELQWVAVCCAVCCSVYFSALHV